MCWKVFYWNLNHRGFDQRCTVQVPRSQEAGSLADFVDRWSVLTWVHYFLSGFWKHSGVLLRSWQSWAAPQITSVYSPSIIGLSPACQMANRNDPLCSLLLRATFLPKTPFLLTLMGQASHSQGVWLCLQTSPPLWGDRVTSATFPVTCSQHFTAGSLLSPSSEASSGLNPYVPNWEH